MGKCIWNKPERRQKPLRKVNWRGCIAYLQCICSTWFSCKADSGTHCYYKYGKGVPNLPFEEVRDFRNYHANLRARGLHQWNPQTLKIDDRLVKCLRPARLIVRARLFWVLGMKWLSKFITFFVPIITCWFFWPCFKTDKPAHSLLTDPDSSLKWF